MGNHHEDVGTGHHGSFGPRGIEHRPDRRQAECRESKLPLETLQSGAPLVTLRTGRLGIFALVGLV